MTRVPTLTELLGHPPSKAEVQDAVKALDKAIEEATDEGARRAFRARRINLNAELTRMENK